MMNLDDPVLLLEQALSKGIAENEEQERRLLAYERSHRKVADALEELQKEVRVNCMVPVGTRALLRGSLVHTNEVLASLGAGYFAKISTSQATRLCQRRIVSARESLEMLRKERDLYEKRMLLLPQEEDGKDIAEHWDEKAIKEWRARHREREKEYRRRMSAQKESETEDPEEEADLFRRLDELEIEEELEEFGEEEYDEETSSSEEEDVSAILEEELRNLNEMRRQKSDGKSVTYFDSIGESAGGLNDTRAAESQPKLETVENPRNTEHSKDLGSLGNSTDHGISESSANLTDSKTSESSQSLKISKSLRFSEELETPRHRLESEQSEDDEAVIKIHFSHTKNEPVKKSGGLESPADILEKFPRRKSILKIPEDWVPPKINLPIREDQIDEEDEEEEEEECLKPSAYEVVVKDITERKVEEKEVAEPVVLKEEKRMSKFRRDRSIKK